MNKIRISNKLLFAAFLTGITSSSQPVFASVEGDCRLEAKEYGIEPEQQQEYISGCIESRGGPDAPDSPNVSDSMEETYMEPAPEPLDSQETVEENSTTMEQ